MSPVWYWHWAFRPRPSNPRASSRADRDGECLLYEEFYGVHSHFQSGRTDIVYAPDGKTIYLKNPIFGVNNGAWVQGTISDDGTTISIPLG